MRRAVHADPDRIRALFLKRQDWYTLTEAARLLGVSVGTIRREAEADDPNAYRADGAWRFTWRQVAYLALRRWTLGQVHEALGPAAGSLPPLLTLQPITVYLPAYLVRAIEHAAAEEQTSIDDWLHRELIDFASGMVHRMERIVPGFRRAYLFPGQE
jgi:hypothetical protein